MLFSLVTNVYLLPFSFFSFLIGNDDIDVFYHENNITASCIQ